MIRKVFQAAHKALNLNHTHHAAECAYVIHELTHARASYLIVILAILLICEIAFLFINKD